MNTIDNSADIFKALGDKTRLKIVKLLYISEGNLCVNNITRRLNISQPAVSQHLKVLKNAGLVESERMGFHMHYRLLLQGLDHMGIDFKSIIQNIDFTFEKFCDCPKKTGCSH